MMKLAPDPLAQRLSASLGSDAVTVEESRLAEHVVDGVIPKVVCTPGTAAQLAEAVRICSDASATTSPWGGGTAMFLGNPPRSIDVVAKTTRLNQMIEHDHANLTATLQSGLTLGALQAALAPQKQFLPFDPPAPERSTVGGIVAANLNGPRRSGYGNVRDLVIGMKVVLASGDIVKAGGKVVKNVAGYDMCKLFTGSLGTLGIITEVTLRVAPIAAQSVSVIATGTLTKTTECASQLTSTKLLPTAVHLLNTSKASSWQLAVRFDGFAETVARQTHELARMAQRLGLSQEVIDGEKQQQHWQSIADLPLRQGRLVYRLTVPRGTLEHTISTIVGWTDIEPALAICADVAIGTLWLVVAANQAAVALFPRLIALAQQQHGHAIIFAAPSQLKQAVDVWGPTTSGHALMRKIKQEFDPSGLFNPGRFVGGL